MSIKLPYEWKKYTTSKGNEKILLVRIKSDDPIYHRGKIPKGSKIEKIILNTRIDAENMKPLTKTYVRKNNIKGKGIFSDVAKIVPIIGDLASNILSSFGLGKIDEKGEFIGGKFDIKKLIGLRKLFNKQYIMNKIRELTGKSRVTKSIFQGVYDLLHNILNKAETEGGLITFPKNDDGGLLTFPGSGQKKKD